MTPIILNTKVPLLFMGDPHGDWTYLKSFIHNRNFEGNIIVCGDCGIGFSGWVGNIIHLNNHLNKHNCTAYLVRGNHDNPNLFGNLDGFSNVKLLEDYQILELGDEHILTVGGAYSVDRNYRIEFDAKKQSMQYDPRKKIMGTYWPNEPFIYNPGIIDELLEKYNITYIATHSIGMEAFPKGVHAKIVESYAANDESLKLDLTKERTELWEMFEQLRKKTNIKKWVYGHYHDSHEENIYGTSFVLLNCDELYELGFA